MTVCEHLCTQKNAWTKKSEDMKFMSMSRKYYGPKIKYASVHCGLQKTGAVKLYPKENWIKSAGSNDTQKNIGEKERWIFVDSDEESELKDFDEKDLWNDSGDEDGIRPAYVMDEVINCVWISEV